MPLPALTAQQKDRLNRSSPAAAQAQLGDRLAENTAGDALKAPLASPAFTGTPTAPTAAPGTNTTQLATAAFVAAALAALVDSSPAALNTLNELAAALGNDANFATTLTNALALKAPLASPTLTGIPAAPTAAVDTSTTQIATTAFVMGAVAVLATLKANFNSLLTKLDADAGVTDTNYSATLAVP